MVQSSVPRVEDMIITVCSKSYLENNPSTSVLMAYISISDKILATQKE